MAGSVDAAAVTMKTLNGRRGPGDYDAARGQKCALNHQKHRAFFVSCVRRQEKSFVFMVQERKLISIYRPEV